MFSSFVKFELATALKICDAVMITTTKKSNRATPSLHQFFFGYACIESTCHELKILFTSPKIPSTIIFIKFAFLFPEKLGSSISIQEKAFESNIILFHKYNSWKECLLLLIRSVDRRNKTCRCLVY